VGGEDGFHTNGNPFPREIITPVFSFTAAKPGDRAKNIVSGLGGRLQSCEQIPATDLQMEGCGIRSIYGGVQR